LLTKEEEREIDELAESLGEYEWKPFIAKFREKHPEMTPQEVMKKASFVRRMQISKKIHRWLDPKLRAIIQEVLQNACN
jgi:hypothetical protein